MHCRINRSRVWTHRILLESFKHPENSFVTLTYDDDHLPEGGTLVPKDLEYFLKRLRENFRSGYPNLKTNIRYYGVGEYGDQSERPHYHLCLFGVGPEWNFLIEKSWKKGFTFTGTLTKDSASYCAQYVTKKMTSKTDPRLKGRHPEFARMSLKPGLGASAMQDAALSLKGLLQDAPSTFTYGRAERPLGRYLKEKLHDAMQLPEEEPLLPTQKKSLVKARLHSKNEEKKVKEISLDRNKHWLDVFKDSIEQRRRNRLAKKTRKTL